MWLHVYEGQQHFHTMLTSILPEHVIKRCIFSLHLNILKWGTRVQTWATLGCKTFNFIKSSVTQHYWHANMAQSHQSFVSKNHQIDTFWLKFSPSRNHNMTYIQLLKWNGNMFTTLLWIQHLTKCRLAYYWQVEHDFFSKNTNQSEQTDHTKCYICTKYCKDYWAILWHLTPVKPISQGTIITSTLTNRQ